MTIENKIEALEKAVRGEARKEILNLLSPNMETDVRINTLPKHLIDKLNKLEETGIKILET